MPAQAVNVFPVEPEKFFLFVLAHISKCKIFGLDCRGYLFFHKCLTGRSQVNMQIPSLAGLQGEITVFRKLLDRRVDGLFAEHGSVTDILLQTAVSDLTKSIQNIKTAVRQSKL